MFPKLTNRIAFRPRSGRIREAKAYCGFGRSKLYELAAEHPGLFLKNGSAVIVDFDVLDRIIDALPQAKIRSPRRKVAAETANQEPAA
jgi:hypothetical protein